MNAIFFTDPTDPKDQYFHAAEELQREYSYPYEMMPLLYAIIKSTRGNCIEAQRLIQEGNTAFPEIKEPTGDDYLVPLIKIVQARKVWIWISISKASVLILFTKFSIRIITLLMTTRYNN